MKEKLSPIKDLPDEVRARQICAEHGDKPELLLEMLHDIQDCLAFVPQSVVPVVAEALNLSRAEVHGVISFYHDFRREPAGNHVIRICRAESCQAQGADQLGLKAEQTLGCHWGETTPDGKVTLEAVYCLGNCALSPAVMVDGRLHGRVDASRLDGMVAALRR